MCSVRLLLNLSDYPTPSLERNTLIHMMHTASPTMISITLNFTGSTPTISRPSR